MANRYAVGRISFHPFLTIPFVTFPSLSALDLTCKWLRQIKSIWLAAYLGIAHRDIWIGVKELTIPICYCDNEGDNGTWVMKDATVQGG